MPRFWQVDFHPLAPPTRVLLSTERFAHRFTPLQRLAMAYSGNGDAWLHLSVVGKNGDVAHTSPPLMTDESVRNFNAVKRALRWTDSTTVVVDTWPLHESRFEWADEGRFYTARI